MGRTTYKKPITDEDTIEKISKENKKLRMQVKSLKEIIKEK